MRGTLAVVDALQALVHTESLCARALWAPRLVEKVPHAFDESIEWLGDDPHDAGRALEACERAASKGARTAAVVTATALADARASLRTLVENRRAMVIHVVVTPKSGAPTPGGYADVHAVSDLGAGVLLARDAQDASDLVIIAHRAAEDAEAPIIVVHDGYPSSHARDRVVLPDAPLVRAALEPAPPPLASVTEESLPAHRRAGARVPFALASAMRTFERLSARRADAVEALHTGGAEIALVAGGALAETARAVVEHARTLSSGSASRESADLPGVELRSRPHAPALPLGLVQVVALRPFPGAAIVKALARTRAVAVLERIDAPLAQSNPLAVEVKAAFADALTWTPGYPGIGRIPEIFSGSIDPSSRETTPGEIFAVIDNLLLGEQGRRVFHVGGTHSPAHRLEPAEERTVHPPEAFAVRWHEEPSLLVHLLADLYGAHVRATPRPLGARDVYDVVVSPSPVRAHHGASTLDLVAMDPEEPRDPAAIEALREGGSAVMLGTTTDAAASKLSSAERGALRARGAKMVVVPRAQRHIPTAAMLGAILRARPPSAYDRARVLADAERSLRAATPPIADAEVRATLEAIAHALDAAVEVGL